MKETFLPQVFFDLNLENIRLLKNNGNYLIEPLDCQVFFYT